MLGSNIRRTSPRWVDGGRGPRQMRLIQICKTATSTYLRSGTDAVDCERRGCSSNLRAPPRDRLEYEQPLSPFARPGHRRRFGGPVHSRNRRTQTSLETAISHVQADWVGDVRYESTGGLGQVRRTHDWVIVSSAESMAGGLAPAGNSLRSSNGTQDETVRVGFRRAHTSGQKDRRCVV